MLRIALLEDPIVCLGPSHQDEGLGFCGPSCWGNAVLGVVKDAVELGHDAFNSTLNVPGHIKDAINSVKHGVFDGWAAWVKLNGDIGRGLVNGFNAAYDGVVEIAKEGWKVLGDACRLFKEYKQYINIGIQIVQQDYANAAANLAEVAAQELGLPPVVQGTDSQITQVADFVCSAVEGINVVAALAEGIPPPPPLSPSSQLVVEDGVARPPTAMELRKRRYSTSFFIGGPQVTKAATSTPKAPPATAAKTSTPKIIIGASVVAAAILLAR